MYWRRTLLPILLGLIAFWRGLSVQEAANPALAWERYELANGLEVVLLPDSSRDDVAVELWTHAGTRHEPAGKFGMAHFFEHVLPHGPLLRARAVSAGGPHSRFRRS